MAECSITNPEPMSATLVANELAKMHATGREFEELAHQTEYSRYGFVDLAVEKVTLEEPSSLPSLHPHYNKPPAAPGCTSQSESRMNDGYIAPAPENIREYRIWSAYNVVCGCLLLGIVALIMSSETAEKKKKGDMVGARRASKITAIVNFISTIIGISAIALFVLRAMGVFNVKL